VRQPADHGVARDAFTAAATTPGVGFDDPARQHRTIWVEPLTGDFQAELIEASERGQVRASESDVVHVEVLQMRRVGTPSSEDLDPHSATDAPTRSTPSTVKSQVTGEMTKADARSAAANTIRKWLVSSRL